MERYLGERRCLLQLMRLGPLNPAVIDDPRYDCHHSYTQMDAPYMRGESDPS